MDYSPKEKFPLITGSEHDFDETKARSKEFEFTSPNHLTFFKTVK